MLRDDALAMILLKYAFFSKYSITNVSISHYPVAKCERQRIQMHMSFWKGERRACIPPLPECTMGCAVTAKVPYQAYDFSCSCFTTRIFWLTLNRFFGSYFCLIDASLA
jgi:hypothetical protein